MASWAEFEAAAPTLSKKGRLLLEREGHGKGLLATVRADIPPRLNPVSVAVVDGRLHTFVIATSAKRTDLDADGRFALHSHMDEHTLNEFSVRGRARRVSDQEVVARVGQDWFFTVDDSYLLYELDIERALLGERASADDWPPRYSSWTAATP